MATFLLRRGGLLPDDALTVGSNSGLASVVDGRERRPSAFNGLCRPGFALIGGTAGWGEPC